MQHKDDLLLRSSSTISMYGFDPIRRAHACSTRVRINPWHHASSKTWELARTCPRSGIMQQFKTWNAACCLIDSLMVASVASVYYSVPYLWSSGKRTFEGNHCFGDQERRRVYSVVLGSSVSEMQCWLDAATSSRILRAGAHQSSKRNDQT